MTLDQDRIHELRNSGNDGVIAVLYLDIDKDAYVAAGEPGDMVLTADAEVSKKLLRILVEERSAGYVEELLDDAASAVIWFAQAGTDRQAFMASMMEALHDDKDRETLEAVEGRKFLESFRALPQERRRVAVEALQLLAALTVDQHVNWDAAHLTLTTPAPGRDS